MMYNILIFLLAQLKSLCQDLHNQIKTAEENRYDLEFKIRKQDYDVKIKEKIYF